MFLCMNVFKLVMLTLNCSWVSLFIIVITITVTLILFLQVTGFDAPKPVTSFGHFGFDEALMKAIRKSEYTQPTPIQSQSVPIALSGRDAIGIAKTGSGKTAAFIWPMLVHIMDQRELAPGEGPIGLILAPTRELAQQIYTEARRFGKVYNIQVSWSAVLLMYACGAQCFPN